VIEAGEDQARILIVDDQQESVLMLKQQLGAAGFGHVTGTIHSDLAVDMCARAEPDLLLLDLQMPEPDGFEVLNRLRARLGASARMPILVLTEDHGSDVKREAAAIGATDFLHKPVDSVELILRIKNLLAPRLLQLTLDTHNSMLERRVRERTRDLEEARMEIIERLARAAEYRDDDLGGHTQRVGHTSALLAEELRLPDRDVSLIRRAAPLHDVGKLGISDSILLKPGALSESEFEIMKHHATIGAEILAGSHSELLQLSEQIALTHHECWDGTGYPRGLKNEEIPIAGRIVAVADVFDVLTHDRPYKQAWSIDRAIAELESESGRRFDPEIVAALLRLDLVALAADPIELQKIA
jgi:putative two-component system response regulator